jgi:uncharacterized protein
LPDPVSDKVNDWAEVLSRQDEARLTASLASARAETEVHVVVVTVPDHADFGGAGESLETYVTRLFNAWGIGDRGRNDGIMVLVTPARRAIRIELGRGYGTHWEETAKGIIDDTFLPAFAEGEIAGGIQRGSDQVLNRIARPFAKGDGPGTGFPFEIGFIALVAAIIFGRRGWRWAGDQMTRLRACPNCGRRGLHREHVTDADATTTTQGQGTTLTQCRFCDHQDRRFFVIPATDSKGSSGSGFGGGRSSGGDASGRL